MNKSQASCRRIAWGWTGGGRRRTGEGVLAAPRRAAARQTRHTSAKLEGLGGPRAAGARARSPARNGHAGAPWAPPARPGPVRTSAFS